MYYIYNDNNEIVDKSNAFDDSRLQMFSTKDILLDKLALFDGEIYDTDDIEYWRLRRTKELNDYIIVMENGSYMADGILMDCNERSVSKLSLGLQLYDMNGISDDQAITVVDYNNIAHSVTLATYKQICLLVGNEYSLRYLRKWEIRAIIQTGSLEDLKNLVIGGIE